VWRGTAVVLWFIIYLFHKVSSESTYNVLSYSVNEQINKQTDQQTAVKTEPRINSGGDKYNSVDRRAAPKQQSSLRHQLKAHLLCRSMCYDFPTAGLMFLNVLWTVAMH